MMNVRSGISLLYCPRVWAALLLATGAAGAQDFQALIQLPDSGGERVTVIEGLVGDGLVGAVVANAGDVNADGYPDLLVTAPDHDIPGMINAGSAHVVFGGPSLGAVPTLDLGMLDGTSGFSLLGLDAGHFTGSSGGYGGDLNGDGIDDLLIGARGANVGPGVSIGSLYVLFGSPNLGAGGAFDLSALDGSNGFVLEGVDLGDYLATSTDRIGDVDADGYEDLIVGAPSAGDDALTFDVSSTSVPSVTGGDFDQDLDVDLVSISEGGQYFTILYNDGSGSFNPVDYPLPGYPQHAIAADFDLDGIPDLVAATRTNTTGQISLVRSIGPGLFSAPTVYPMGEAEMSLAVGDLNGDGFPDVIATSYDPVLGATSGELYIFLNDQSGGFTTDTRNTLGHPRLCDLGDFDGDQDLDVVVYEEAADQLGFWQNDGTGVITKVKKVSILDIYALAVGDFNGDQYTDIVGVGFYVNWLENKANGAIAFTTTTTDAYNGDGDSVELVDLDGDSDLDVSIGTDQSESELVVLENQGGGTFSSPRLFDAPGAVRGQYLSDVDGDGAVDLFCVMPEAGFGATGDLGLFFGNGDTTFRGGQSGEAYVVFGGPGVGAGGYRSVADLDGTNGFTMTGHAGRYRLGTSVAGLGDVNSDGIADFAVSAPGAHTGGSASGSVHVVYGSLGLGSSGTLELHAPPPSAGFEITGAFEGAGIGSSVAGRGDFDGDGLPELVIGASTVFVDQSHEPGIAYLIRGGLGAVDLGSLDGSDGFRIEGPQPEDGMGCSVSLDGDVNGDGLRDWIVGADRHDGAFSAAGRALVVFGRQGDLFGGYLAPSALDGANGFAVEGEAAGASLGRSVAGVADLDADGVDDLALGEPNVVTGVSERGRTYVFYGRHPSDPTVYCTAGTTSSGCQVYLSSSGIARLETPSGFMLTASDVEGGKQGIFFWGLASKASPWGAGSSWLCVAAPVVRTGVQNSGGIAGQCDGGFLLDFNTWLTVNPSKAPPAGSRVYAQAWFRDPPSPKQTSLSDALSFVVLP